MPEASAAIPYDGQLDLGETLGPLRRGQADPTIRFEGRGVWRAMRTPDGPASLHLELGEGRVDATGWGPGSSWAVANVPAMIGLDDRPEDFRPGHPLLFEIHRRHLGLRLGRTGLIFEALLPTILEQKVPGVEAWASYAKLVRALGEPAPGETGLILAPSPARLRATPYWVVHRFGIEQRRFAVITYAASHARSLEATVSMDPPRARRVLMSLPGIGRWSAAEVTIVAHGDRDAVSLGDYHLPHQVAWALAGEPRATDERMLELLEPYRGHRARVIRLLTLGGIQAPRFGPRMRLRRIAAI